ncbi:hypothetical protein JCM11491_004524 [Sporobolomyces phaffii]
MSGTRDFVKTVLKLYPTSAPVSMSDYHARNPLLDGPFDPPSLANKFVHFVHDSAKAARLHPPVPEPFRPPTAMPRLQDRRPELGAAGATARRFPQNASASGSAFKVLQGEKRDARKTKPEWKDVPYSNDFSNESDFLQLPPSVLDLVLSDPALNLRDHLALAATCRCLRACYVTVSSTAPTYSSLWRALVALRPPIEKGALAVKKLRDPDLEQLVYKIWSNALNLDIDSIAFIRQTHDDDDDDDDDDESDVGDGYGGAVVRANRNGKKKRARNDRDSDDLAIRSKEWDNAIDLVHTIRISKTEAKKQYRVSDKELQSYLASFVVKTPSGSSRVLYLGSAVEALALRLHGGVSGHAKQ